MEDIKHEVMVNYLSQQQHAHLWIGPGSSMNEGVLLRKAFGNYVASPMYMLESPFAHAIAEMNCHVGLLNTL